ncbi:S41 family peptidase [Foetidibacter luteolus]|uniref:S41 family peptidase n=1 Tax=Foetidibacter luteolus TaxID=2608880 RepID=UPI00129A4020|nr:S41 family peptidase [Foetidibacter luteolus]
MNNKKLQVALPLLLAVVLTVGMWIGFRLREKTGGNITFLSNSKKSSLQEILDLVNSKYVDKLPADSVNEVVIEDVLSHLDPHSVFIPAKDLMMVNEDLQGNFQGIGVEFQIFDDTVNILNVLAGGPSAKAGVEIGDKIIKVNDTVKIAGINAKPDDVRKLLRGPKDSKVNITVWRDNAQKKIEITRGTIPLPSVDVAYMITPKTGFIRINKFSETTYEEFMYALEGLQKKGLTSLVLDLRGNGGGILQEAADIADEFLDDQKMIVYTKGSNVPSFEYKCKRTGLFETGKLAVLVDETSASASEILAGALQDWDRATIIGRRTFGKGLVQQQFQLTDGSALRLTIARYYTPLGRNIQKPYNKGKDEYEEELIHRFHDGEVVVGDTSKPKGPAYKTPRGRLVYGGGGITPDVFVAFDTTTLPREINQLYLRGTLNNFVYNYFVENKAYLQKFTSPEEFEKQFTPGEKEWQQLTNFAKKDSVDISSVPAAAKSDLLKRLEALIARQIWRTEGYFEVNNLKDPMVAKGIDAVK